MEKSYVGEGRKLLTRRQFLVGSSAVFAATLLVSCGTKNATNSKITLTNSGSQTSSQGPKYGGILRQLGAGSTGNTNIGWPAEMVGYNGAMPYCAETLLRNDNTGKQVGWLAESYQVADDLKSITFTLKQGIKFHDGSELNAVAVKWNLDNYIESKMQSYWSSVEVTGVYSLRVNFTEWRNTLPMSFSDNDPPAFIVSKDAFDKHGKEWMRANPVGTGPFKFKSYQLDASLDLEKNPDYWIQGKPYLDQIKSFAVADQFTIDMLVKSGEADLVIPVSNAKDVSAYTAEGWIVQDRPFVNWAIVPDTANPDSPWAKQQVREAVEYALDREGIAKAFGYDYWKPLYQIPPRYTLAYDPNFALARKFDPDKAKELLAQAGLSGGFDTTMISIPFANKDVTVAVQESLSKAGIRVKLEYPELGKWSTYMGPGTTWPTNSALYTLYPAIDTSYIGGLLWLNVQLGKSWARPPELTDALNNAVTSRDIDVKLVRTFTDMISKNSWLIPVNEGVSGFATQPYVHGFDSGVIVATYEDVWINR